MKRALWIGDAACDSGFSRATHHTLETVRQHFDVAVLGINFRGDPSPYQSHYRMYPARNIGIRSGGDILGVSRLPEILDLERPDVIVIQNDPWHIDSYMQQIAKFAPYAKTVGSIAIDGVNCAYGDALNKLDHVAFWTKFAETEARNGGVTKPTSVTPLGVDLNVYHPGDRLEARRTLSLPTQLDDAFIFLNVNRNQPRKRIDLSIRYFAEWLRLNKDVDNAYLYLHVCPTGDVGVNVDQLARYYGVLHRTITATPSVYRGASERLLSATYRAANAQISTTQGEGFGLTTLEGMACGLSQIFPGWSALEELFGDVAYSVPCTSTSISPAVNVIGGVPDEEAFITALDNCYRNVGRTAHEVAGLLRANETRFDWGHIGRRWTQLLLDVATD